MTDFTLSLLAGRTFEHALRDALAPRYGIVRTGDLPSTHRGPAIDLDGERNVLTDMQIFGKRYGWLEVKAKTKANLRLDWNRLEHGIDKYVWESYQRLQYASRMPVYIAIFELDTQSLLMRDINTLLSTKAWRFGKSYGKDIINFARDSFVDVGAFTVEHEDMRTLTVTIDWENFETFMSQQQLIAA